MWSTLFTGGRGTQPGLNYIYKPAQENKVFPRGGRWRIRRIPSKRGRHGGNFSLVCEVGWRGLRSNWPRGLQISVEANDRSGWSAETRGQIMTSAESGKWVVSELTSSCIDDHQVNGLIFLQVTVGHFNFLRPALQAEWDICSLQLLFFWRAGRSEHFSNEKGSGYPNRSGRFSNIHEPWRHHLGFPWAQIKKEIFRVESLSWREPQRSSSPTSWSRQETLYHLGCPVYFWKFPTMEHPQFKEASCPIE